MGVCLSVCLSAENLTCELITLHFSKNGRFGSISVSQTHLVYEWFSDVCRKYAKSMEVE